MDKSRAGRNHSIGGNRNQDESGDSGMVDGTSRKGSQIRGIEEDPSSYLADDGTRNRRRSRRSLRQGPTEDSERARGFESDDRLPTIRFLAALAYSRDPISINGDGEIKVVFEVPASEMGEAIKLLLYRNKSFLLTISENEDHD